MSACNLLMITSPEVNQPEDLEEVARWIHEIDPRVRVEVRPDHHFTRRKWLWALRRTMLFSPAKFHNFKIVRGSVYQGSPLAKSEELSALEKAGIRIPAWAMLTQDNPTPDLSHLGEYVVVKPDRGGRGAKVKIVRSSKVRWEPQETKIAGKSNKSTAQRFIYTGPWPVSYRVTTLFGQCLFALKVEAHQDRAPLPGPDAFSSNPGLSVVSNSKGCTFCFENDQEIIRFGEEAHRAFPKIPLLGVDIVRDASDSKLYCLEVNASGFVWHFTSRLGLGVQNQFGLSFESQFDGRRKAARILAGKAMELAA
jgi:hypothetical protein